MITQGYIRPKNKKISCNTSWPPQRFLSMSDVGEDSGDRETVEPASLSGRGDKKHRLSDVDSPVDRSEESPSSKRHSATKRPKRGRKPPIRDQTVSSEADQIETPSKPPSLSTSRQSARALQQAPNTHEKTTVFKTPRTAERYGIPASVAKKIQKHVVSFPNLMDVICNLQQTAVERNKIPTPEENGMTLMKYYETIVCLILSVMA